MKYRSIIISLLFLAPFVANAEILEDLINEQLERKETHATIKEEKETPRPLYGAWYTGEWTVNGEYFSASFPQWPKERYTHGNFSIYASDYSGVFYDLTISERDFFSTDDDTFNSYLRVFSNTSVLLDTVFYYKDGFPAMYVLRYKINTGEYWKETIILSNYNAYWLSTAYDSFSFEEHDTFVNAFYVIF